MNTHPSVSASTTTAPLVQAPASLPKRVARRALCVSAGRVETRGSSLGFAVDADAIRAHVAGSDGDRASVAFTYRGPTLLTTPLASGEIRRQIGLALRAHDTCNVVYVMWHVQPTSGIFVSVKRNPGKSTHDACGAGGYINLRPTAERPAPELVTGTTHNLAAAIVGDVLEVYTDGSMVWEGAFPAEALGMNGPSGLRSDNASFDFDLHVYGETHACTTP